MLALSERSESKGGEGGYPTLSTSYGLPRYLTSKLWNTKKISVSPSPLPCSNPQNQHKPKQPSKEDCFYFAEREGFLFLCRYRSSPKADCPSLKPMALGVSFESHNHHKSKQHPKGYCFDLAERVGFEPTVLLPAHYISSVAPSTNSATSPLHVPSGGVGPPFSR